MTPTSILVAGIGNIFLGDDAFGTMVAQRLLRRAQPPGVRVVDFGIRGLDLVYALLDGCDTAILIDAVPFGGAAGTLYLLEPQWNDLDQEPMPIDAHSMDPVKVLRTAASIGARPRQVFIVGCEPAPATFEHDDTSMQMCRLSWPRWTKPSRWWNRS